jgi:hypothetical protein
MFQNWAHLHNKIPASSFQTHSRSLELGIMMLQFCARINFRNSPTNVMCVLRKTTKELVAIHVRQTSFSLLPQNLLGVFIPHKFGYGEGPSAGAS